jgi:hypothetical protein
MRDTSRSARKINQTIEADRKKYDAGTQLLSSMELNLTGPQRRALLLAIHVDTQGLAKKVSQAQTGDEQAKADALDRIREVADHAEHATRLLLAVRLHHTLAKLELDDYRDYLEGILK